MATPGAGKTRAAMRIAHKFLSLRFAERLIIVVPTDHLKKQWAEDAFLYGVDLDPNFSNDQGAETNDYHGIVVTYAAVGMNAEVYRRLTDGKKAFVILDEIHHAGDSLTWGDAVKFAFENAYFRLGLSGTPFRRDDNPIPFVTYDEHNVSKADYAYSYQDAIMDNVCRAVHFPAYDGIMEWITDGVNYKHNFEDLLDASQSSERLKTALDPNGEFLRHMISDAHEKLLEIREKEFHTDAAGLVFAIDQEHARKIGNLIAGMTGEIPVVVLSDDKESSKKIKEFRETATKWIVCVKMISEGVDIPRLRVGVYATNIRSELFFRQAVGRFVRILNFLQAQDAYLFVPKDSGLVEYAAKIEEEREHALDKAESGNKPPKEKQTKEEEKERAKKEFAAVSSIVTDKVQLELGLSDKLTSMFNLPIAYANKIAVSTAKRKAQEEDAVPIYVRKNKIRDEINELAKKIAIKRKNGGEIDWDIAHKEYMRAGGKPISIETLFELEKRKKHFEKMLEKN